MLQRYCDPLSGNLISHPAPLLTFSTIVHSFTPLTKSFIQSSNSLSSFLLFHCPSCTASLLLSTSFFFLISDSLPFPNSHSYPSAFLHLFPILSLPFSPSFSHSISWLQEMDSFPIQGVGGLYLLSQTKRSLCESSKNTKKKRKADKNQKPPHIRLSHTNTHFTSAALMQSISLTIKRHKILLYTVHSTHEVQISPIQCTARAPQ